MLVCHCRRHLFQAGTSTVLARGPLHAGLHDHAAAVGFTPRKHPLPVAAAAAPAPLALWKCQTAIGLTQASFVFGSVFLKSSLAYVDEEKGETFSPIVYALAREGCAGPILLVLSWFMAGGCCAQVQQALLTVLRVADCCRRSRAKPYEALGVGAACVCWRRLSNLLAPGCRTERCALLACNHSLGLLPKRCLPRGPPDAAMSASRPASSTRAAYEHEWNIFWRGLQARWRPNAATCGAWALWAAQCTSHSCCTSWELSCLA